MAHTHLRPVHLALVVCLLALVAAAPAAANGAFPDEFSVFFPVGAPHRILLAANFGMIVSEDDGAKTFDSPPIFPPTTDILIAVEIAKSNPQVIYTTSVSPNGSHPPLLWVTQNRGASWTSTIIAGEAANTQPRIIAIDPQDATV